MDCPEDEISLPEQVEHSEENPGPLPGEGGEEEHWMGEESRGQWSSLVSLGTISYFKSPTRPLQLLQLSLVQQCTQTLWSLLLTSGRNSEIQTSHHQLDVSIVPVSCRPWLPRMSSYWRSSELRGGGAKRRSCSGTEKRLAKIHKLFCHPLNWSAPLWPCFNITGNYF